MKLADALREKLYDVRLVDKLLTEGKISKKDMDNYLSSLPDEEKALRRAQEESDQE